MTTLKLYTPNITLSDMRQLRHLAAECLCAAFSTQAPFIVVYFEYKERADAFKKIVENKVVVTIDN